MNRSVNATLAAILWAAAMPQASAKDLEAKRTSQAESLSGTALQGLFGQLRRTPTNTRLSGGELLAQLHKQGLMQDQRADSLLGAEWAESADAGQSRRTLRRLFRDDVTGQPALRYRDVEYYRGRPPAFDDAGLIQRASAIAYEVAGSEQFLGPDEDLRAEETLVLKHRSQGPRDASPVESTLSATVILRRYVGGTPVLGTDGEVTVELDAADGSVVEVSFPMVRFEVVGTMRRLRGQGKDLVDRALVKGGFGDRVSRVGDQVPSALGLVIVRQFRCGFVAGEDSRDVGPGCIADVLGASGAQRLVLPVQEAPEAPPQTR